MRDVRTHHDYKARPVFRDESGNEGRSARRQRRAEGELPGFWNVRRRPVQNGSSRFVGKWRCENDRKENHVSRRGRQVRNARVEGRIDRILDRAAAIPATRRFFILTVGSAFGAAIHWCDEARLFEQAVSRQERVNQRQHSGYDCLETNHGLIPTTSRCIVKERISALWSTL